MILHQFEVTAFSLVEVTSALEIRGSYGVETGGGMGKGGWGGGGAGVDDTEKLLKCDWTKA